MEWVENLVLKARMIDLAQARRRLGYRYIRDFLRREGVQVNHKPVRGLCLPKSGLSCKTVSRQSEPVQGYGNGEEIPGLGGVSAREL